MTNSVRQDLTSAKRGGAQLGKHLPQSSAVPPFIDLDLLDRGAFGGVLDRAPVSPISKRCGQLPRIGALQYLHQLLAIGLYVHCIFSGSGYCSQLGWALLRRPEAVLLTG